MRVHEPVEGFTFLCAEIGVEDVREYLAGLPPIDLLYCAPPNSDWMPWWRRQAGLSCQSDYEKFIRSWLDVVLQVDAAECHLEVGVCRSLVEPVLDDHYAIKHEQPARYAAPSTARGTGMSRSRSARFTRLSYSRRPSLVVPTVESSDAFLQARLKGAPKSVCFDPCIGKGLLSRIAVDFGHECHGIELNADRIKSACVYVEDHWTPSAL